MNTDVAETASYSIRIIRHEYIRDWCDETQWTVSANQYVGLPSCLVTDTTTTNDQQTFSL